MVHSWSARRTQECVNPVKSGDRRQHPARIDRVEAYDPAQELPRLDELVRASQPDPAPDGTADALVIGFVDTFPHG